jgi:multidrug efflux pump subunit AcrB
MQHHYKVLLEWCLEHAGMTLVMFAVLLAVSLPMTLFIGKDFFPYVDSGQMRLHVNPPPGLRVEDSEQYFAAVEKEIRQALPPGRIDLILDNIGLPNSGINLAFGDSSTISDSDGEILIALKPGPRDTQKYMRLLRDDLAQKFPDAKFFFAPANMTNQILDFGLPAPIDLQVVGRGPNNYQVAQKLATEIAGIPGAVDVHVHQEVSYPTMQVDVDRSKARQIGLTEGDVAQSMLISLTGTSQVAPSEWLNPATGVNYQVVTQTPNYRLNSLQSLGLTPVTSPAGNASQLLGNLATFKRSVSPILVSHYNIQPVYDVFANVDRRDLGGVASEINKIMDRTRPSLAKTTSLELRGEVKTMNDSFVRLGGGIVFAILLVYLLMAVNFQSWLDPLIILMAVPCAFCGILWMLFVTQTTFSVPSLMGAIMTIGVATANSILLVVFANDERLAGRDQREAALNAGHTRLRPVLMTALAMIIGMLPMALAFGEGGEQNAPLGRAVIGGLLFATVGTLFLVPTIYSLLKKHAPIDYSKEIDDEAGPLAGKEASQGGKPASHGSDGRSGTQEQPA